MGINLEWRQGLVGHYCINCHILLFICLLVSLFTYVHLSLPKKSMKPLPGIEPEPSTNQVDVLTITPQRYYLLSEGTRHYLLKLKVTYLQTFLKCIDLKLHVQMQNDHFNSFFLSQLSDKVFYLHFTLYTLTTPKKCRQINSESQSRNYTVFVSGLIVHLFVVRNSRHWPCSRWLTCVYRACTSDGKWSSFLSAMAKWLCDLCKFHSCNTENVKCYLLWTHFFGSDF